MIACRSACYGRATSRLWALKFLGLSALSWPEDKAIPLSVESQGTIFRVGRRPNPWQPPDWSLAGSDGTFGNRFDDPDGTYRVLYASSQRLGCYLETLARFRVDLTVVLGKSPNLENQLHPAFVWTTLIEQPCL